MVRKACAGIDFVYEVDSKDNGTMEQCSELHEQKKTVERLQIHFGELDIQVKVKTVI